MTLRQLCFWIFRPTYERKGIQQEFKPLFARYIGVEKQEEYPDLLATLGSKVRNDLCLAFDGEIPLGDGRIMSYFSEQLKSIDVYHIKNEDVELYEGHSDWNIRYANSLRKVVAAAFEKETFLNEHVKLNFVKKLIIWSYHYLRESNISLEESINPKCIYYGSISRHEIYFLFLLYYMGFDVLYLNPLKEEYWDGIDTEHISKLHKYSQILPVCSFWEYTKKGHVIIQETAGGMELERELESTFYTDGVFKPWQFRNRITKPVLLHGTLTDLLYNYQEPAKVRQGFSVTEKTVQVPHFFQKIEGEYEDFREYQELVKQLQEGNYTVFLSDGGVSLLPHQLNRDDMLSLSFCMTGDGGFSKEKVKACNFYPLSRYNEDVQDFILEKINETLLQANVLTKSFGKEERLQVLMFLLHLHPNLIRMIDNFDYPEQVPKAVFFLEREEEFSEQVQLLIAFLFQVGFDLVVLNPSGLCNLSYLSKDYYDTIRLETMIYEETAEHVIQEKKSLFQRLFKGRGE